MADNLIALLASVRALTLSIQRAVGRKLDKNATAANSTLLGGKTFAELTASTQGLPGEIMFVDKDNVSMSFDPSALVTEFRKAPTAAELTRMKDSPWLMADVFNNWRRISHAASGTFPAIPAELTGWSYTPATDRVQSTINSVGLIGLVSPYAFSEYTFDVVISSTGGDDDAIGLILAFKRVGGLEHTLAVTIQTGGFAWDVNDWNGQPSVYIGVNNPQQVSQGKVLLFRKELGTPAANWNLAPYTGGVRIKAVRTAAGSITVQVMREDGTNWPAGEIKWTAQLPELFKSECPVGYFAISQPAATFKNLVVPTPKSDILDTRDSTVNRWNNTTQAWAIAGKASAVLPKGRLYKNTETPFDTSFLTLDGDFVSVGSPGSPSQALPVNELVTLATGVTKQYDLQTLLGANSAAFDLSSATVRVFAKDTNPASPIYNGYANAEGLVVYGIKDNRYVIVANQSGASIDLHVKVLVNPLVS